MIPSRTFPEVEDCKYNENNQSYDLLDDLELEGIELAIAKPVCRNLKAIFEECNSPAGEDRSPDGNVPEFEVTVPGEGHEHIARDEQQYCSHTRVSDGSADSLLLDTDRPMWIALALIQVL